MTADPMGTVKRKTRSKQKNRKKDTRGEDVKATVAANRTEDKAPFKRDQDRCLHCWQVGHWARQCPRRLVQRSTIFVGNIPVDDATAVTEHSVCEFLRATGCGSPFAVRLCYSKINKAFRGKAFVDYGTEQEAHACVKALHGASWAGNALSVEMLSQEGGSAATTVSEPGKETKTEIEKTNVDTEKTKVEMEKTNAEIEKTEAEIEKTNADTEIAPAKIREGKKRRSTDKNVRNVETHESGKKRRSTDENASAEIDESKKHRSTDENTRKKSKNEKWQLFVGQVAESVTEEELNVHFSLFTTAPQSVRLLTHKETGGSRGCAFVDYPSKEAALQAQHAIHKTSLKNKRLIVELSQQDKTAQAAHRTELGAQLLESAKTALADAQLDALGDDQLYEFMGSLPLRIVKKTLADYRALTTVPEKVKSQRKYLMGMLRYRVEETEM